MDPTSASPAFTSFQWLTILGFLLAQAVAITVGLSRAMRKNEKENAKQREADRVEHDQKHQHIWEGINKLEAWTRDEFAAVRDVHGKDIRALEVKIAERPDRESFEEALEKMEKRIIGQIAQLVDVVKQLAGNGK